MYLRFKVNTSYPVQNVPGAPWDEDSNHLKTLPKVLVLIQGNGEEETLLSWFGALKT